MDVISSAHDKVFHPYTVGTQMKILHDGQVGGKYL